MALGMVGGDLVACMETVGHWVHGSVNPLPTMHGVHILAIGGYFGMEQKPPAECLVAANGAHEAHGGEAMRLSGAKHHTPAMRTIHRPIDEAT